MQRSTTVAAAGLAGLCASLASTMACIVESRCANDFDCAGNQRCSLSGSCVLECEQDEDCHVNGVNLGKRCSNNRCEFLYAERVAAPNICLEVLNPRSAFHGEELCLSELQGKVVQIYFAQLT